MNQKTKISITLIVVGIVASILGWMGFALYESNSLLDLVSIASAIMLYLGPPIVIAGMILAVKSVDSSKTKLLVALFSIIALFVTGITYGVIMHRESESLKTKSEAYEKCDLIKDKKSALYSSCRQAARRLP